MKIIYSIFILLICTADKSFSQKNSTDTTIHLTKFPPGGILLDKGWKFKAGDDPDWAKPGYDDSKWQPINPAVDIYDLLPQLPQSGIVWFRVHLLVDTAINNQLALNILQSGASEIYLNGKLIHSFGILSANMDEVKAYSPFFTKPLAFSVAETGVQILAIRYALQPSVTTKRAGDKIQIRVSDNGMGIPEKILDKIYQPFFITKPTGQGTGLGLSMSYDIIKAHGGEIKVNTKENEGTEFTIKLPV